MDLQYKAVLDNLYDGLYFVDTERRITYWNRAAEKITGYSASEVIGLRCADNILMHVDARGNSLCLKGCPLSQTMHDGISREADIYLHHKDGSRLPVSVRIAPVRDAQQKIIGGVELFCDNRNVHAIRQKIEELEKLSFIDPLTKVSNRRAIEEHLQTMLQELKRYGLKLGLYFIDIDNFKHINDTLGHQAGDAILSMVAKTIMNNLRPFDIVGRWGGEEFICVIRNIEPQGIYELAERLRFLVANSFIMVNEKPVGVTVSIGATWIQPKDTMEAVIQRADEFMYRSKQQGKNRTVSDCRDV